MPDKEYKTYRQLLTILRGRGMTIGKGSQGSRVMRILEKENYYNVINGYKDLLHKVSLLLDVVTFGCPAFSRVYAYMRRPCPFLSLSITWIIIMPCIF